MKFRIEVGSFWHRNELHTQGAIVESDSDLEKAFPGRLKRLSGQAKEAPSAAQAVPGLVIPPEPLPQAPAVPEPPTAPPTAPPQPPPQAPQAPQAPQPQSAVQPKGELVDSRFDFNPQKTGLHVFKRGSKFYVYDVADLETPLNAKGLKKAAVLTFIRLQCEE